MSTPTAAHGALPEAGEREAFSQFLSDVHTAAGLVSHGKQCKALGERLGAGVMRYLAALSPASPAPMPNIEHCLACSALIGASPAPAVPGELLEILKDVVALAQEAHSDWDADRSMKVGKKLLALSGYTPRYDARADRFHAYRDKLAATPAQQTQSDAVAGAVVECEDCEGSGYQGEAYGGSDFQPPERDECSSCNGSGRWRFAATPPQQATPSAAASIKPDVQGELTDKEIELIALAWSEGGQGLAGADEVAAILRTMRAALKEAPGGGT